MTRVCYDATSIEEDCIVDNFFKCIDPNDNITVVRCAYCKDVNGNGIDCANAAATTCGDINAAEITCTPEATSYTPPTYVYTIETPRSVARDSWSFADVVNIESTATITF